MFSSQLITTKNNRSSVTHVSNKKMYSKYKHLTHFFVTTKTNINLDFLLTVPRFWLPARGCTNKYAFEHLYNQ